ncbi:alpha/beta fold hydrolase [Gordonia soli]|uniref:AB hydrolase-1 domain-containing protein n=1 Tax=Gordonia soli NBRC 108243 TaxID=1223545 RepID=M0QH86_9ACTN|nr:alpha/beta hydrolase [Gordonia soli]GAC66787.1 hypothetical protein GS4_04_00430 [Gordonia soli NBRC 108243]
MTPFNVATDLGRLHVDVVGSGPPVVLWHSMFVDSTSWSRLVPLLPDGRSYFLVDAPSAGQSDPIRRVSDIAGCAAAAHLVVETIRERTGSPSVDWVGNAWGGHVGIRLAADHADDVRNLVAISSPTHPISTELRRKIALLLPLFRLVGPRGPVRAAMDDAVFTEATRASDAGAVRLLHDSLARSGRAMIPAIRTAILNRTDLTDAAESLSLPVLFVTTDDRGEWTPEEARAVAARMHDAREVTVRGARIIPAIEQPGATASAISGFWQEIASRGDAAAPVSG